MAITRSYKRGLEFPHEGFVQAAIESHFLTCGFDLATDSHVDLRCTHPATGETWHIEAKGVTTQVGLDFRTCLGQLLQGMTEDGAKYGIAIPDTSAFHSQVARMSPSVITRLQLHWLVVSQDGSVRIESPPNALPTLCGMRNTT